MPNMQIYTMNPLERNMVCRYSDGSISFHGTKEYIIKALQETIGVSKSDAEEYYKQALLINPKEK